MGTKTQANDQTVVHEGTGGQTTAPLDFCKTPSVPIPYPNISKSADTANGTMTVFSDKNSFMLKDSFFDKSNGDNSGKGKGVISQEVQGIAIPITFSMNVIAEDRPVFRRNDLMFANAPIKSGDKPKAESSDKPPKGCEFLNPDQQLVSAPQENFDKVRKTVSLGEAKDGLFKFPGDLAPTAAKIYEATIGNKKIPIAVSTAAAPAGKAMPTVQSIAQSLGAVPTNQLGPMNQIAISANPNPSDAYWATQYNTPGFTSAATGGGGNATFYPVAPASAASQARNDSNMIHESGHTFSKDLWAAKPAEKTAWQDAITKDGKLPSKYAGSSIDEDFSESLVMYSLSKGTPCEEYAKKLYPERYKKLDELMAPKK